MYACSADRLRAGHVVARALHDARGEVLLQAGTTLTDDYIRRLRRRGVASVWVNDGIADEISPVAILSGPVRRAVTQNLTQVFDNVSELSRELFGPTPPRTVTDVLKGLGDRPLPLPTVGADAVLRLYEQVEGLIAEALSGASVAGLESLKTHSSYVFEHSVDVAAISVVLGREAGVPHGQLRELALGGLLHDIGYLYVEEATWRHPGPLTRQERADVRRHPQMGYELVRRMPVFSILPAHIAYQHHERQDGRGYPRGLEGAGRIVRRMDERVDPRRMMLLAEIAAVADVYSALTSDRPHRPALLPDAAMDELELATRGHLNAEIVALLSAKLPRYPIGHWVEVRGGRHAGWRGVVESLRPGHLHTPKVLLVVDPQGGTGKAVELDLAQEPDSAVACISGEGLPEADHLVGISARG
jgi:hypothetical protein